MQFITGNSFKSEMKEQIRNWFSRLFPAGAAMESEVRPIAVISLHQHNSHIIGPPAFCFLDFLDPRMCSIWIVHIYCWWHANNRCILFQVIWPASLEESICLVEEYFWQPYLLYWHHCWWHANNRCILFSGYLVTKFGGKYLFGGGVFLSAIFTLLTPLLLAC